MKIDGGLSINELSKVPARAQALEAAGYDGVVSAEISSDPFLPLALAAEHTERVDLLTSIAVAFARNPMQTAQVAHDLNAYSKGRMILGLGSQIRPHITRRFSMPWDKPASRMREFIQAMRAIWDCWYEGKQLDFRGEFYTHTLMTPMFVPVQLAHGAPRVYLAAVGPKMTEVAAETADGLIAHAFTTEKYMREVTLPAIERGLAASGRSRADFEVDCPLFVVSGKTEEEFAANKTATRAQIAFYGSTPAYKPVLACHGWGELQTELNQMSKQGLWKEMGERIDDDILNAFAVVGEPESILPALKERCRGTIDRLLCTFSFMGDEQAALRELKG